MESVVCVSFSDPKQKSSAGQCEDNSIHQQIFRAWEISEEGSGYIGGTFDGGSQRTFITEGVAWRLNFRILININLELNMFASTSIEVLQYINAVKVRLKTQYDDTECTIEEINRSVCIPINKQLDHRPVSMLVRRPLK